MALGDVILYALIHAMSILWLHHMSIMSSQHNFHFLLSTAVFYFLNENNRKLWHNKVIFESRIIIIISLLHKIRTLIMAKAGVLEKSYCHSSFLLPPFLSHSLPSPILYPIITLPLNPSPPKMEELTEISTSNLWRPLGTTLLTDSHLRTCSA